MTNSSNTLTTGLQHQQAGRLAEAEQIYRLLLKEKPDFVDALNLLGALVYEDSRYGEAQAYFERVLTLKPGADAHNSMGIVLKAQGKYQEAVDHYRQALALKPDQPEVLSNLGNALKDLGEIDAAIATYEQALALRPTYAEAHNNLGIARKEQGQLEDAIRCYREAMRIRPNYAEAHHNLGAVLRLQGDLEQAVHYFHQAIALKPTYADAYVSLGGTLQQQGKPEEAIVQYHRLVELKPHSAEAHNNLALAFYHQGQTSQAIAAFQKALELQPNFPGACNNLGNLFLEAGQVEEAIRYYQQAIDQRPNYPEACNNLANALQKQGQLEEAIAYYHKALELRPNFVEALSNLGAVLKDQKKLEESISCLEAAISLGPELAEIHNNLGNAYQDQGRMEEAIACYRRAVELKPDLAEVHSNLGNMLQYEGEFEAAFEHFQRAIEAQPDFAGVYNNQGIAFRNAGQIQEAFAAYNRAIELNPDFVEAHWNKALNHLLLGDFATGFEGYEWRLKWSKFLEQNPPRSFSQPRWDGSPLEGKTILLYAEQGMGDAIQFIRYVALVKQQGGRVIVECHPPLVNLFQGVDGIEQVIPLGSPLPDFHVHAPLMSLPHILGTTLANIPAETPYLVQLTPSGDVPWLRRDGPTAGSTPAAVPTAKTTLHVGLVWDGNPQNPYNKSRTVPLQSLLSLTEIPGLALYSLQKEPKPEDAELLQAHPEIQDLRSHLRDFTDTAALINQLDLVIVIDTAVAHLAGALGKPTWLLLPYAPDWRWMVDREDSPWYPTMRLFRQATWGDWAGVLQSVRAALQETVAGGNLAASQPGKERTPKGKERTPKGKKSKPIPHPSVRAPATGQSQPVAASADHSASMAPGKHAAAVALAPAHGPTAAAVPQPSLPEGLKVAIRLHQAGQVEAAKQACETFVQEQPGVANGWHLLGLIAHQERQVEAAIAHYQKVLELDPEHYDTYNNLAVAFHEQGRLDQAIPYYEKVLALKPDYADAHNNYANALREKGRLQDAIHHYQQAIAARPHYADSYNNLGLAYYALGEFEQAATAYRQAIALRPEFPQALNHLGNALKELGHFQEAATYYQRAIALKPDYAKAYNNWGNIFRDEGDLQTAIHYYDQATAIAPDFAEAHWNKALTLLLGGDLERGFAEYEWRRYVNQPSFKSLRNFPGDRWDGSPLNGRTIFLHAEQGMGDILQFIRYIPPVVQQGGRVILECHAPLVQLLSCIPGVQQLVPYGSPPPAYHVQAPLLSLPHILGITSETIPAQVPYIHPPASQTVLPAPPQASPCFKVGLVWSGNPENPYNRTRAIPLEALLSLTHLANITFYSLQKDLTTAEQEQLMAHPQLHNLQKQMVDFVDTAALIHQLDLVISVDTAVTHLAGALAKPVWLLLPHAPDWRWMLHREDSPWYPTMRLFRQNRPGDWADVVERVAEALGEWATDSLANIQEQEQSPSPIIPTSRVTQSAAPTPVTLGWPLDGTTDWGILGLNLALQLAQHPHYQPGLLDPLPPTADHSLEMALLRRLPIRSEPPTGAVLRAFSSGYGSGVHWPARVASSGPSVQHIGLVALEDTHLDPPTLALTRSYPALVTGSQWNQDVLQSYGLNPIQMPFQGIDSSLLYPGEKPALLGDRFVVFAGGRLSYSRGQDLLIAAFKAFQSRHPDALLVAAWWVTSAQDLEGLEQRTPGVGLPVFAEDGSLQTAQWLMAHGLPADAFIDLGPVPYALLGNVLRGADVAVFPSRCEAGMNQTAIASLACGVPTILSNNTGHQELLRQNVGYSLQSQRRVKPPASIRGVEGWGESDVEELVETLEYIYTHRQDARHRGIAAVDFLQSKTDQQTAWAWESRVMPALQALLDGPQ